MKNFTKMLLVSLAMTVAFGIAPQARSQGTSEDIDLSGFITEPGRYSAANFDAPMSTLFDNGPIFNSTGTGAGGANESIYYQGGAGVYGSGCQYNSGFYIADDFTVTVGKTWSVTSMDFFSYQTNSDTTSTITGIYLRIWSGKPGVTGSTTIWGDMTTNRLASTTFANVYRVLTVNGGTTRPVMKVVVNTAGLSLNEGTYWVEWGCIGSLSSGPYAPPVVTAENITGNAIQTVDAGINYSDILYNTYPQGMPFIINGDESLINAAPVIVAGTSPARFAVYPSLNDGLFKVSISCPNKESFTIKVCNNLGMMMCEIRNVDVNGLTERSVDLRTLPAGFYSVIFENGSNREIRKILIIH